MHGISEGRAVAVEDHQPDAPAPGPGATAPNAPAPEADAPAPRPAPLPPRPPVPARLIPMRLVLLGVCPGVPTRSSLREPSRSRILLSIHHPMLQPVPAAHAARPHHARRRPAADGNPRPHAPRTPRPVRPSPPPTPPPTTLTVTTLPARRTPRTAPPRVRAPPPPRHPSWASWRPYGTPVWPSPPSTRPNCGTWPPSHHRPMTWIYVMRPNT